MERKLVLLIIILVCASFAAGYLARLVSMEKVVCEEVYTTEYKCAHPCETCIGQLDILQETFDKIDNARAEINRIKYCSEGNNYRMAVCG